MRSPDPFPTHQVPVHLIDVPPDRLRHLQEDQVVALMESIGRIGLQTPISIRYVEDGGTILVAGAHRLEACRRLGIEDVLCVAIKGDDTDARLWEISENLHHADLSVIERAEHIAEWIRLTEEKLISAQVAPKSKSKTNPKGSGRQEGGINAAVRELGIDRTEAQRAVKIAGLTPEGREAARQAGLDDNQSALLKAAKETSTEAQVVAIESYGTKTEPHREAMVTTGADAPQNEPELPPGVTRRYKGGSVKIGDKKYPP